MKILFLSNPIRRDGAPLRLLEIIEYLKIHIPNISMDLMVDYMEIENIYEKSINSIITTSLSLWDRFLLKAQHYLFKSDKKNNEYLLKKIKRKYDIIYINTSVELKRALIIKQKLPKAKLILHLRELETISLLNNKDFYSDIKHVDEVVAISKSVYDFANYKCGIPKNKITLIYSGTHLKIENTQKKLDTDNITIGSIGGTTHRKGFDFFLLFAKKINNTFPNINFQWIGKISDEDLYKYKADLEKMGMVNNFKFLGSTNNILSIVKNWSLFICAAREEPLGVACIEAGSLGVPILAFYNSGGPEEIIGEGGGMLSNYLDIDDMYKKFESLIDDENLYTFHSDLIKHQVQKFDISNALPHIKLLVEKTYDNI